MIPLTFFATLFLLLLLAYAAPAASINDEYASSIMERKLNTNDASLMKDNVQTTLLLEEEPESNLNDKSTSKLINQLDPVTTVQALQALRDETLSKNVQENVQRRLAKVSASSSSSPSPHEHESRELKPDSTKSAKNDSKCAKNNIENTYLAEMEMCKAEKAEHEDTKAKLAALQEEMSKPHWLFVQVGDKCVLDLSGDTPKIESAHFHEDTELFTDRPLTLENTTSTQNWFTKFNELFNDGNGWPNTAMTFVHDDETVGVVVTAFVDGYIKKGNDGGNQTIYGYNLKQSEEQKKVKSLEEIMGGKDKVEFDHCSFFIDRCLAPIDLDKESAFIQTLTSDSREFP